MDAKMEKHIAQQEILDCLTRYCRGMDRRDEAMMRSAFHDDAVDVHFSTACKVDGFVGWVWPYHAAQNLHQHYISNHTCEIDGDVAHSEIYYQFVGTYPDSKRMTNAGGRYIDRMERRNGEWRIVSRYCTAEWYCEFEMPAPIAAALDTKALVENFGVTRTKEDVSYVRPLTARIAPAG
jgi:hypothetical protein